MNPGKFLSGKTVFVIGGNHAITCMFATEGAKPVGNIPDADFVCFTGGSDVSPELYKEDHHPSTNCNPQRDRFEAACFKKCVSEYTASPKILLGICRGAQFLNVMNGGTLWQDVDNHCMGDHLLMYTHKTSPTMSLSRPVLVTSTHHQMMIPDLRSGAQIWAWAGRSTKKVSGIKHGETFFMIEPRKEHQSDCEIAYYPPTKSLCFQPHPEYSSKSTKDLFFTCIERVLSA